MIWRLTAHRMKNEFLNFSNKTLIQKKIRTLKKIVKSKRFNSHDYGEIITFFPWNRRGITLHSQNHKRTIKSRNCIHKWKKEANMDPSYTQKLRHSPKKCLETPSDAILILVITNYTEFCKYFKILCTYCGFFVGRWFNTSCPQSHFGCSIGFFWGPFYFWGQERIQNWRCDSRSTENHYRHILWQSWLWQNSWGDGITRQWYWHDADCYGTGALLSSSIFAQKFDQRSNGRIWIDHSLHL